MTNINYDYVIVGGGPSGLTLAYTLGKLNKKCLLIDKNDSIGGCHRVTRIDTLFSEHGPRIYLSAYINLRMLLKKMDLNFYDFFTKYDFSLSSIILEIFKNMKVKEIMLLSLEFIKLIFNNNHGKHTSIERYMTDNNFSESSMSYINKLCLSTDGASIENYTLFKLLQLFNQKIFYNIYQPVKPNDINLIKRWIDKITETKNVDIMLNTDVTSINIKNNKIDSINTNKNSTIFATNFILAIPPVHIATILQNSADPVKNAFGDLTTFTQWAYKHNYITYIPITFHWNTKLNLKKIWGVDVTSDWNITFILLSDYMKFDNSSSQTVISCCISVLDVKSKNNNKTANECDQDELIAEVFQQLKNSYPYLPNATKSILHNSVVKNGSWINNDTAYIYNQSHDNYINSKSSIFSNLYNVGTHNGNSTYYFTSMESAVSNAIYLLQQLFPETKKEYLLESCLTLTKFIRISIIVIICLVISLYIFKK